MRSTQALDGGIGEDMANSATIGVERQAELKELKEGVISERHAKWLAWDEIKRLKRQVAYWKHRANL